MKKQVCQMLGAATLFAGVAYAAEEIRINVYTGSFNTSGEITGTETLHTSATWDAGFAITFPSNDPNGSGGNGALPSITDGGGFTQINIYAENNPETHDIGLITVGGSGSNNVHLIIGTQTRATINEPPGVFGRDCKGIDANRPARLQMSISRHLIANIDATDIRRIARGLRLREP